MTKVVVVGALFKVIYIAGEKLFPNGSIASMKAENEVGTVSVKRPAVSRRDHQR